LQRLINRQQREPFAALFGGGVASSSDGQFFQAGGPGNDAGRFNVRIPTQSGHRFRFDVGRRTDLMPATIPK
jgi:hypothetical protein